MIINYERMISCSLQFEYRMLRANAGPSATPTRPPQRAVRAVSPMTANDSNATWGDTMESSFGFGSAVAAAGEAADEDSSEDGEIERAL